MNNQGVSSDNLHIGDVTITNDLNVEGDIVGAVVIEGDLKLDPGACLEADCLKPSTASNPIDIKNSSGASIASFNNDQSTSFANDIKSSSGTLNLKSLSGITHVQLNNGDGIPPAGLYLPATTLHCNRIESESYYADDNPRIEFSASKVEIKGDAPVLLQTDTAAFDTIRTKTPSGDLIVQANNGQQIFRCEDAGKNVYIGEDGLGYSLPILTDTLGKVLTISGANQVSFETPGAGSLDHTALLNLNSGLDGSGGHTNMTVLQGRSTGQSLYGGIVGGETLLLSSNTATPLVDDVVMGSNLDFNTRNINNCNAISGLTSIDGTDIVIKNASVDKLEINTTENKSLQTLDMNNNDIVNVGEINNRVADALVTASGGGDYPDEVVYLWSNVDLGVYMTTEEFDTTAVLNSLDPSLTGINSVQSFNAADNIKFDIFLKLDGPYFRRWFFLGFQSDLQSVNRSGTFYGLDFASSPYTPRLSKDIENSLLEVNGLRQALDVGSIGLLGPDTWMRFNYNNDTADHLLTVQCSNDFGAIWVTAFTAQMDDLVYKFNFSFNAGGQYSDSNVRVQFISPGSSICPGDTAIFVSSDGKVIKGFEGVLNGVETIDASRPGDLKLQRNGIDKFEVTTTENKSLQNLDMGTNNITNVNLVDGENISTIALQQGTNTNNITALQDNRLPLNGFLSMTGDLKMDGNQIQLSEFQGRIEYSAGNILSIDSGIGDIELKADTWIDCKRPLRLNNFQIFDVGDPTAAQMVATKAYADLKLPLTGGTLTDSLTISKALVPSLNIIATDPGTNSELVLISNGFTGLLQQTEAALSLETKSGENKLFMSSTAPDIKISTNSISRIEVTDTKTTINNDLDAKLGITALSSILNPAAPVSLGFFTQTADVVYTQGVSPDVLATLIGAGIGTNTVPANSLSVGSSFFIKSSGIFTNSGAQTYEFDLRVNNLTILSSLVIVSANIPANSIWDIEADFVIRTIGPTGSLLFNGIIEVLDTTNVSGWSLSTPTPVAIDTTIANTIDILVRVVSTGDIITSQQFRINKVY